MAVNRDDKVAQHYDSNESFADNLNHFIPGFEYPNWSYRTIGEVLDTVSAQHVAVIEASLEGSGKHYFAAKTAYENPENQERFEFYDPFAECQYSKKSMQEIVSVCEKLGANNFQVVKPNGKIIQVNKVDGKWERDDDLSVVRKKQNAEAGALASELESRIRAEFREDLHDNSRILSEVRMAYREMGVDSCEDAERCALQRIEARSTAYADAEATAKASKIEGSPDLNTRLRIMRNMTVTVLSPEVLRMWAELDIRDFLKIQMSPHRKEDAGLELATNMAINAEYKTALIEKNPFIAAMATTLDKENDQRIAAKDERKAAEYISMRWAITQNDRSGMVGLMDRQDGKEQVIEFGGVPAIQKFAKENSHVPSVVIDELLGREGGYRPIPGGFMKLEGSSPVAIEQSHALGHIDGNRLITGESKEEVWAVAANQAIDRSSLHDAELFAYGKGKYSVVSSIDSCTYLAAKVMELTSRHVVLSLGRSAVICAQAELDRAVVKDEVISVTFEGGKGYVSPPAQEKIAEMGR